MPTKRLIVKPGVNTTLTPTANRDGWVSGSLGRWRSGMPEVMGGWSHICPTPVVGVARGLHYWSDLTGNRRFAVGTNERLFLETGTAPSGTLTDITPSGFVPGKLSSGASQYSLLVWSLDSFGQNLIGCPSGGTIYQWIPGQSGPAAPLANAPTANQGLFVMMSQQMIMAYGCSPLGGGPADPMLIRWCDQSNNTAWTASTTNQAGSFRLPRGNRIIGGLQGPNFALIWTDLDVWMVSYIGFPLVFSFTQIGSNCGLIAQKAVGVLGGVPFWMSDHGFFSLSGSGPTQLPCPVWDSVYKDLDFTNQDKCLVAPNYHFSEMGWFFPSLSGGSSEVDSYVKVNVQEGEWDFGPNGGVGVPNPMTRTAWTDQNQPGDAVSVDLSGLLQQAESGFTMDNAGTVPASFRTGFRDISDGDDIMTVDQIIPDFKWLGPNPSLNLTIYFRAWPGDTPTALGPFKITPTTEQINLRLPVQRTIGKTNYTTWAAPRAREVALQLDNVSGWFRLGACRLHAYSSGGV